LTRLATLLLLGRVWNRNRRDKALSVRIFWTLENLVASANLNKSTMLHYCDPVGQYIDNR
jgi:hypothetical protein